MKMLLIETLLQCQIIKITGCQGVKKGRKTTKELHINLETIFGQDLWKVFIQKEIVDSRTKKVF